MAQNAWIMNKDGVAVGHTNADRFAKVLSDSPVWDGPYPTRSPGQQWVSTFDGSIIRIMEPKGKHTLRAKYEIMTGDESVHDMDPATWKQAKADPGLRGPDQKNSERAKSHLPLHRYE